MCTVLANVNFQKSHQRTRRGTCRVRSEVGFGHGIVWLAPFVLDESPVNRSQKQSQIKLELRYVICPHRTTVSLPT